MSESPNKNLPVFPSHEDCMGCRVCAESCPRQAIRMTDDAEGFVHPVVQAELCVGCHACERVCPTKNETPPTNIRSAECFVATNRDAAELRRSASGSVFPLLAAQTLSRGGVVFGVILATPGLRPTLTWTENAEGVRAMQGSKYVQADPTGAYRKAKEFLDAGREVLFSGTPCQIAALNALLGKPYEKLLTVGLICHGVCTPKIWQQYVAVQESTHGSSAVAAHFREKVPDWEDYSITMDFENGERFVNRAETDPYMQAFLRHLILRPSCHQCHFRFPHWQQDITLSDYWKVRSEEPDFYNKMGVSQIYAHTGVGKAAIAAILPLMKTKQPLPKRRSIDERRPAKIRRHPRNVPPSGSTTNSCQSRR